MFRTNVPFFFTELTMSYFLMQFSWWHPTKSACNEIVACDGLFSKVKIRDHHSSALVSIIVEVHLDLVIKNENENKLKAKIIPFSNQEK